MKAPAPAPDKEALAKQPEAIVISQYEVLLADIEQAVADSADVSFDYNDPAGNKAARSYVAKQRKLRGRIEYARKEAKAWALEYGRAVDGQAKELEAKVLALITPHQQAIEKIEQAEARRIEKHRQDLALILDLGRLPSTSTEDELAGAMSAVRGIDASTFEEFSEEAAAAKTRTIEKIELAMAARAEQAAKDAELEELRAEKAKRDAEIAELKAAAAKAAAPAAKPLPESPHQAAIATARGDVEDQAPPANTAAPEPVAEDPAVERKRQLCRELMAEMRDKSLVDVARLLVLGELHRCLTVNWEAL